MSRWSALPPVLAAVLLATLPAARAQDALPPISPAIVLQHSAATDALQVRALMQEGHYQQALGWAAHLSGAHPGQGDGAALYGWLLHLGGQSALALPLLEAAEQRWPDNPSLGWVLGRVGGAGAPSKTTATPAPLAPVALLDEVPAGAEVVASATLLDAGHAVAPLVAVDRGSAMWVRDGLGRTRRVTLERSDAAHGLALLRLGSPLTADVSALDSSEAAPLRTAREPFAGSVAYAAGYAPGDGAAQWPTLSLGFLGRADAAGTAGDRPLGFALPAGTGGGPVFDAAGRWVGVAAAGATDAPRFIPLSALYALAGDPPAAGPAEDKPVRLSADAVYETAMRVALQLILRQTPWNGAPSPP